MHRRTQIEEYADAAELAAENNNDAMDVDKDDGEDELEDDDKDDIPPPVAT